MAATASCVHGQKRTRKAKKWTEWGQNPLKACSERYPQSRPIGTTPAPTPSRARGRVSCAQRKTPSVEFTLEQGSLLTVTPPPQTPSKKTKVFIGRRGWPRFKGERKRPLRAMRSAQITPSNVPRTQPSPRDRSCVRLAPEPNAPSHKFSVFKIRFVV